MKKKHKLHLPALVLSALMLASACSQPSGGNGGGTTEFENEFENPWQEPWQEPTPGDGGNTTPTSLHKFAGGCNGNCFYGLDDKRYNLAVTLPKYCTAAKCTKQDVHYLEAFKAFDAAVEASWEKRLGDYHDSVSTSGITSGATYKYSWDIGDGYGTKKAPCLSAGDLWLGEDAAWKKIDEFHP